MIAPRTQCPICFDDTGAMVVLHRAPGSTADAPSIPHSFHSPCIEAHFRRQLRERHFDQPIENEIQFSCPLCQVRLIPTQAALMAVRFEEGTPIVVRIKKELFKKFSKPALKFLEAAGADNCTILGIAIAKFAIEGCTFGYHIPPNIGYLERNQCPSEFAISYTNAINMALIALTLLRCPPRNETELSIKLLVTSLMVFGGTTFTNFCYTLVDQWLSKDADQITTFNAYGTVAIISTIMLIFVPAFLKDLSDQLHRFEREAIIPQVMTPEAHRRALEAVSQTGHLEEYFTTAPQLLRN